MKYIADWVRQKVSNSGTSNINLTGSINGFVPFSAVFANNDLVHYTIEDGFNREIGIGKFTSSSNSITRLQVLETLINGVYDGNNPAGMSFTTNAIITVTGSTFSQINHKPIWKNMYLPIQVHSGAGITPPTSIDFVGGINALGFSSTVNQSLGFSSIVNHDVAVGTDFIPFISWSPTTANTGNVRWGITLSAAARGTGVFSNVATIFLEQSAGLTVGQNLYVAHTNSVFLTPAPDTVIIGKVFRDATHINDTYPDTAVLNVVAAHYQANALGTPNKDPDFYAWS